MFPIANQPVDGPPRAKYKAKRRSGKVFLVLPPNQQNDAGARKDKTARRGVYFKLSGV
jgi:hypothetical protein